MIKKTIIEEYRLLTEDIAVVKSCITSNERKITYLLCGNRPREIGAVDLTKPKVQSSGFQDDLITACRRIHDLEQELTDLRIELKSLYDQRNELEKAINDLGDLRKQIVMLKIKGWSTHRIAKKFSYTERRINQIVKECEKE